MDGPLKDQPIPYPPLGERESSHTEHGDILTTRKEASSVLALTHAEIPLAEQEKSPRRSVTSHNAEKLITSELKYIGDAQTAEAIRPREQKPSVVDPEGVVESESDGSNTDWAYPEIRQLWWPDEMGIDLDTLKAAVRAGLTTAPASGAEKGIPNPELCGFCRVFFDTFGDVLKFYGQETVKDQLTSSYTILNTIHHDELSELERSASDGCCLCALFLSIIGLRRRRAAFSAEENPFSREFLKPVGLLRLQHRMVADEGNNFLLELFIENQKLNDEFEVAVAILPHESLDQNHHRLLESSSTRLQCTSTDESLRQENTTMDLARRWLENCMATHEGCRQGKEHKLPTRLLRIDGDRIRLCLSAEHPDCTMYASLSHCWGRLDFLKLLKSNISLLMDDIPHHNLPKTFQDAVQIARDLGFSWLWIDSLCIVQDDPEDWRKESRLMATVYGESGLNIAATAAPDGRTGCLFERDPTYARGVRLQLEGNGKWLTYDVVDDKMYRFNLLESPLLNRAWVLQERLLAARNLHFGLSQLFWECKTKDACETFPIQIPRALCASPKYLRKQSLARS